MQGHISLCRLEGFSIRWVGGCGLNVLKNFTTFFFKNKLKLKMIGAQKRHKECHRKMLSKIHWRRRWMQKLEKKMYAKRPQKEEIFLQRRQRVATTINHTSWLRFRFKQYTGVFNFIILSALQLCAWTLLVGGTLEFVHKG